MNTPTSPSELTLSTATDLLGLSPEERLLFELSHYHQFGINLEHGDYNPDVPYIQKALVVLSCMQRTDFTTRYDSITKNGIAEFQRRFNVGLDFQSGIFNAVTRERFNAVLQDRIRTFQHQITNKLHKLHKRERRHKFFTGGGGLVLGVTGTCALALGAVLALRGSFETSSPEDTSTVADLSPAQQNAKILNRRIDKLELPSDISNMGAIFYIANPVVEPETMLMYDTLIDYQTVGEKLLQGRFLLMGVDEKDSLSSDDASKKRIYRFTVPSEDTGEIIMNHPQNMMGKVTWADALNLLTHAHNTSDQEVITYIQWWYHRTYGIDLAQNAFRIARTKDGAITDVFYNDPVETIVPFEKIKILPGLPTTSRHSNRTVERQPKPLTVDGKLLLWTGVHQDLAIPEGFLTQGFVVDHTLPNGEAIRFTTDELAESLKVYLVARDSDKVFNGRDNVGRFVTKDDPIIKRLVAAIIGSAHTRHEKRERIRVFAQKLKYRSETEGVEVNRPAAATYLQGWGDCNNLSTFLSTLYATAGEDVALFYLERTPEQRKKVKNDSRYFSSHIAPAILKTDDLNGRYYTVTDHGVETKWIGVEATAPSTFGEENYEDRWLLSVTGLQHLNVPLRHQSHTAQTPLIVSTTSPVVEAPHPVVTKTARFSADVTQAARKCRRVIRDGTSSPQTPTLFTLGVEHCNVFRMPDIADTAMLLPFEMGAKNVQKGFVYDSGDPTHGSLELTLRIAQNIDDGTSTARGVRFDAEVVEGVHSHGYRILTDSNTIDVQASWNSAGSALFTGMIPDGASCMTATTFPEETSHRPSFPCGPSMADALEVFQKEVQSVLDTANTKAR